MGDSVVERCVMEPDVIGHRGRVSGVLETQQHNSNGVVYQPLCLNTYVGYSVELCQHGGRAPRTG